MFETISDFSHFWQQSKWQQHSMWHSVHSNLTHTAAEHNIDSLLNVNTAVIKY